MDDNKIDIETVEKLSQNASTGKFIYNSNMVQALESFSKMSALIAQSIVSVPNPAIIQYQQIANALHNVLAPYAGVYVSIQNSLSVLGDTLRNMSYSVLSLYNESNSLDEEPEINDTNEKIIAEILLPDQDKIINIEESPVITLSPINDRVLKYLSENPEAFYQLSDNDFEVVMAEIYSRLGYDVTRTQATRDGGKDIIIRKADMLGDFIYYVECKKYAPRRHVGVGIVRNLVGTINTDRVNGGILATTSFFTKDARKFILNNKWDCQIKMHDYDVIRKLLDQTLKY